MSNTPIQITTELSQVLGQINQQLNSFQKEMTDFRTETKVATESIKGEINTFIAFTFSLSFDKLTRSALETFDIGLIKNSSA